jgi:hypothetical protein
MFKKKSFLGKYWLKYTDKPQYKLYKWELNNYSKAQRANFLTGSQYLNSIQKIKAVAAVDKALYISHSGNAGDIIYALPTIKKIHEITGVPIHLCFVLDKPMNVLPVNNHPLGTVMLNKKMADMLSPLIASQDYIHSCETYADQQIHIDLDYFRAGLVPLDKGNIARWCGYITGVNPDLYKNWLTVEPDTSYADMVLIARSGRYQNITVNYAFLNKYPNLKFIGVEAEYKEMKQSIPNLTWLQVNDFLQLAQMVAGCKFFIGNQSFPFSIAEGLKVPRILELSLDTINVVPEGEHAYDFLFQEHFESLVESLYNA